MVKNLNNSIKQRTILKKFILNPKFNKKMSYILKLKINTKKITPPGVIFINKYKKINVSCIPDLFLLLSNQLSFFLQPLRLL